MPASLSSVASGEDLWEDVVGTTSVGPPFSSARPHSSLHASKSTSSAPKPVEPAAEWKSLFRKHPPVEMILQKAFHLTIIMRADSWATKTP